jgi:putative ABC transport system permease protein
MLLGDRAKYLALVIGLSFAVLLIAQQGSIFLGLLLRSTGPLQNVSQPDLWITDPYVKFISETRYLSEVDLQRVRSVPGVAWAEPFFSARGIVELPGGGFKSVNVVGIDRTTMIGRPPEVLVGNLEDLRIPDAVFVEEGSIRRLGYTGPDGQMLFPKVGDVLKLNDRRAVIVGVVRAKAGFDSPAVMYTSYDNAVSYVPLGRNRISFILVGVKPEVSRAEVQASINRLPELAAFTRLEMQLRSIDFILKETGIGINFGITVTLGVIIGLAISAAIFYQFTLENLRNFAVLKAMGARWHQLVGMIFLQAIWVGLIGFGIGVGVAGAFSLLGRRPAAELSVFFPWQLLVGALGAMILCVLVASFVSLQRVLRLEPAVVFK